MGYLTDHATRIRSDAADAMAFSLTSHAERVKAKHGQFMERVKTLVNKLGVDFDVINESQQFIFWLKNNKTYSLPKDKYITKMTAVEDAEKRLDVWVAYNLFEDYINTHMYHDAEEAKMPRKKPMVAAASPKSPRMLMNPHTGQVLHWTPQLDDNPELVEYDPYHPKDAFKQYAETVKKQATDNMSRSDYLAKSMRENTYRRLEAEMDQQMFFEAQKAPSLTSPPRADRVKIRKITGTEPNFLSELQEWTDNWLEDALEIEM